MINAAMYPPEIAIGDLYRDPKRCAFWYDHKGVRNRCCIPALVDAHALGQLARNVPHPCSCGAVWAQAKNGRWRIEGAAERPERSKPKTHTLGKMALAKTAKRGTR